MSYLILEGLLKNWIYVHRTPFYLLTDQGSGVDGEMMTVSRSVGHQLVIVRELALQNAIFEV